MLSPGTPTAPKAVQSALCNRDIINLRAHGEAKGLTPSSPSGTGNKLPRTPSGWQSAIP
jgi:hypothetical protein